jgi:hypothetical protein
MRWDKEVDLLDTKKLELLRKEKQTQLHFRRCGSW